MAERRPKSCLPLHSTAIASPSRRCCARIVKASISLRPDRLPEDAEDAVQETLWAATRALKTFRGSATAITSWLSTIVRHECYRLLDRHHRVPHVELDGAMLAPFADPIALDDEVAMRQRSARLAEALAALPPLHREVILLRDIQGLSAPEAGAALGISLDALKSRLHRARASLRDLLDRRDA